MPEEKEKQERAKKLEKDEEEKEEKLKEEVTPEKAPDEIKKSEKKAMEEEGKVEKPEEEESEKEREQAEDEAKQPTEDKKDIGRDVNADISGWTPKTKLGKDVLAGKITDIDKLLDSGQKIIEPEIVDKLIPNLKSELILIGGRRGKGGGIKRIPIRITATMNRSGRRFMYNSFAVVGNGDGIVGLSKGRATETREAIQKAINKAKTNIIKVKRGCGSWECGCGGNHSIPYKTEGKSGSVRVVLIPAPKGLGLVADDESKKILKLAGIQDVWIKTFGNTAMRINLISALFDALKNLYQYDR